MAGEIRSLMLQGPAGRLEALLNLGEADCTHTALVCHPHPLHGGTMHNKVVYHAMKSLSAFGFHVLRFNFRGAGLSEGEHDHGRGEVEDVRAALHHLAGEFGKPMLFAGFSFGASTGLRAACPEPRVAGLISLGTPVAVDGRAYTYRFLEECRKPKLFISGGEDPYSPRDALKEIVGRSAPESRLDLIEGTGHFFEGRLDAMQRSIEQWVAELTGQRAGAATP